MSTAITIAETRTMATSSFKSGMFGLKNEEQAFTLMLLAQAENIHPIQAMQMYSVINGLPSLKTTEMISRYMRSGGKIIWLETTDKKAKAKFVFDGNELEYEYTWEDATKAGLVNKDNWKRMPKEMLRARLASSGIRMSNPACLNNMYSVEEAQEIEVAEVVVEEVEIVETEVDRTLELKNKLKKDYNYTEDNIQKFAKYNNLKGDNSKIEMLLNNDELLKNAVTNFESGE